MGFSLKKVGRVALAVGTGGLSELPGLLSPGMTTQEQVPLETPEQRAARIKLMGFANTGKFNDFTAGEDIGIKPGDYSMTGAEKTGLSELQTLLASGIPEQFRLGDEALRSILNPDPNYIASQFDPFKTQVMRQIDESNRDLKRSAAFAGNLYSTDTIKKLGDVQVRGNESLTAQLASLTDAALNRRAAAIPLAYQAGKAQEDITLGRVGASQTYGALPRTLTNAAIEAANQELLRRRNEKMLPINAATSVAGQNANFGVPSVTTQNPNPMLDLLTAIIGGGSKILAAKAGA